MASIDTGIVCYILFTSPEELIQPTWLQLFQDMMEIDMVNLFCIDEVHLFVKYGLSFRKKFSLLQNKVFSKMIDDRNNNQNEHGNGTSLKVPILCMTATFNAELLELLNKMTNFTIGTQYMFWSNGHDFQKRHIKIAIQYTNQYVRYLKKRLFWYLQFFYFSVHLPNKIGTY